MKENQLQTVLMRQVKLLGYTVLSACVLSGAIAEEADRPSLEEKKKRHGKPPGRPPHPRGAMEQMFQEVDLDGDQAVNFEEFSQGRRVSQLPTEHQEKLFKRLDRNEDGKIDKNDAPPEGERPHGRSRGDVDGNGEITFEEFSKSPRVSDKPEELKRKLFDRMDHNKDGVLNSKDWKHRRGHRGPHRRGGGAPFNGDQDGDGKISFEEFRKHPRHKDQTEDEQEDLFEKLDENKDGYLDENERPKGPPQRQRKPNKKKPKDRVKPGPAKSEDA